MKSKRKKNKLILMMLLLTLITVFSSCKTIPKYTTDALLKITVPNPYNEAGEPLITYNATSDEVVMDKDYYFDLIEYVIETEEIKKILK